jgi:transcriptional regulator with XRE-family HTH domain
VTRRTPHSAGQTLKWLRRQDGRQQREIAALAEIPAPYLSMLEGGARFPTPKIAQRLADIYGCPRSVIDGFTAVDTEINDQTGKGVLTAGKSRTEQVA